MRIEALQFLKARLLEELHVINEGLEPEPEEGYTSVLEYFIASVDEEIDYVLENDNDTFNA